MSFQNEYLLFKCQTSVKFTLHGSNCHRKESFCLKFAIKLWVENIMNNFQTTLLPFAPHHNFDSSNGYFLYIICPELILNI